MPDFRNLCARMADELDHYRQLLMDDRRETHALAAEARAALAEPEPIVLPPEHFDALQRRIDQPGQYDSRVTRVLSTPAPWDEDCDKTSASHSG